MTNTSDHTQQRLVGTVMAAMSQRSRASAHPADRRRLVEEAHRIAAAVRKEFSVSCRLGSEGPMAAPQTPSLAEAYE